MRFPFLLDAHAKTQLMQIDAGYERSIHYQQAVMQTILGNDASPFLVLIVRRSHVIEDALNQIAANITDLKKPLRVKFAGEEGVDAGGVQKEFFHLCIEHIVDLNYGMFTQLQDRTYWLNSKSLEHRSQFKLIGTLLGLAIYNGVLINAQFSTILYKKLLGAPLTFEDYEEAFPDVAKGLRQLLAFEGDVEETFGLTFQISWEEFGATKVHELRYNGGNISVTNENRKGKRVFIKDSFLSVDQNMLTLLSTTCWWSRSKSLSLPSHKDL
jgi:hypothetical protein